MVPVLMLVLGVVAATDRDFTDVEQLRLPRLFHLDNYERCLAQRGGQYCLGSFRVSADQENPKYEFIKEFSSSPQNFDRTLLHRGYCVSSRCPSEANITLRFERCIQQHVLPPGFTAALQTYSCETKKEVDFKMDIPQFAFLLVIGIILFLNLMGTLYDLLKGGEAKSKLLMSWSLRVNWQRLTSTHDDGDPRLTALAPIQGVRVLLLILVMMTHASEIQHKVYLYNPEFFEKVLTYPITMLIKNGSSITQIFIVLSNFLFGYSLLIYSKNKQLGLSQLPACIMHRIARITPIHMLVVGFAATWWQESGSGPQWAATIGAESQICRKKFWTHFFFLHNFIYKDEHCLLQTWFLAVDMQVYFVASALMLYMIQKKKNRIQILTCLFILSCLLNAGLAYINDWKSLLYIMLPENVRTTFHGIPSFSQYYISPWGSLPSCFIGLITACVHFDMQEHGYKIAKQRWFTTLYHLSIPLIVLCLLAGNVMLRHTSRGAVSSFLAAERPTVAFLAAICILGIANNVDNIFRRVTGWRGWTALGRMSLSVLMLHWVINMRLVASKRTLLEASVFTIAADLLSTILWTYCAALPLTLLVEAPLQRTFNSLLS
ncbi:O-acyltransferase like protein-like [Danaus plexippus]|uniref:O-acyltransferase like protein-like n=1 Tax=Danaus plexippus TaxID=13037 RepID=UPI000239EFD3|nr:O-acyltransferase like protein-like [Danaus plexippus]